MTEQVKVSMDPKEYDRLVADKKPRTIKLVFEDNGNDKFNFKLEGDIERLQRISADHYSASEFWASQMVNEFEALVKSRSEIKPMNRTERRKS